MWYCVTLIFERLHPNVAAFNDEPLWEESLILVEAVETEEAKTKAMGIAKTKEISFEAISGEAVRWRFVEVGDTFEILDQLPKDGAEVFSRFLRSQPPMRSS
jgi:hypothetical protein